MPIFLYGKCWRDRKDCEAVHCVDETPPTVSEDDVMNFNYTPKSFVCCGVIDNPVIKQDQYRLCFKNPASDEMSDNDLQDLTSIIAVVGAALNLDAVRKVNTGIVEIPAEQAK